MHGFTLKIKMLVLAKVLPCNGILKVVNVYKTLNFVNLSPPAKQNVQLWVKRELEIVGVLKITKRVPSSMTLNFGLSTVNLSIYK